MVLKRIKKFFILSLAATSVSFLGINKLYAQNEGDAGGAGGGASADTALLKQIVTNTNSLLPDPTQPTISNLLAELNTVPVVLAKLGEFILAWTSQDDSSTTANLQSNFTQLGNLINQNLSVSTGKLSQLNTDMLGSDATANNVPYANDLTYSTLLGMPFFAKDPRQQKTQAPVDAAYNYIKNASAINTSHIVPGLTWQGDVNNQKIYGSYYNTVTAVESYNGYILSNLYAEGNQFNTLQQALITQASDPTNWFAQVASENIGFVLRQLLLYQSQIFILLTQMVQTEKQIAAASAMTNSLLITSNQRNEIELVARAQGITPRV